MSLVEDYIVQNKPYVKSGRVWHVGTENTLSEGIRRFNSYLKDQNEIIIDGPEICDHLVYGDVQYIIVVRALPKLEYLLWKFENKGK